MDQRVHWLSARVCHRNLYVHVGAPRRDVSRLRFHCLCVVGEHLKDSPGVAAKVLGAITDINVNMISQGASEINISFVIDEEHVDEVVRRLHKDFFSDVKHLTEIFE